MSERELAIFRALEVVERAALALVRWEQLYGRKRGNARSRVTMVAALDDALRDSRAAWDALSQGGA